MPWRRLDGADGDGAGRAMRRRSIFGRPPVRSVSHRLVKEILVMVIPLGVGSSLTDFGGGLLPIDPSTKTDYSL